MDDLVASGEVIKDGDGYYAAFDRKDMLATDANQSRAIKAMMLAFDLCPGDFVSVGIFSDGAEVRVNQVDRQ